MCAMKVTAVVGGDTGPSNEVPIDIIKTAVNQEFYSKSPPSKKKYNLIGFSTRTRKLCCTHHQVQTCNQKRSSFDSAAYHEASNDRLFQDPELSLKSTNPGHSPTMVEVKKMNQQLIQDNQQPKRDFHKASIASRLCLLTKMISCITYGWSQRLQII